MSDDEKYVLTPLGLLTSIGVEEREAKRILDAVELHLRRHYGAPSAIVFDGEGFTFARLEATE